MRRNRILVVMDKVSIGEALRLRPLVASVRKRRPESEIAVVVPASAAEFFEADREADHVISSRLYEIAGSSLAGLRVKKAIEFMRLLLRVGAGYGEVITFGWGSSLLDVLARIAGRRTIGYSHRWPRLVDVSIGRYDPDGDVVEQTEPTLRAAGLGGSASGASAEVHTESDDAAVDDLLLRNQLMGSPRLAVVHVGSDWACQQWQPARWAELTDRLIEERGVDVIFTGLPRERDHVESIRDAMRRPSTSLVGQTSIGQLAALLKRCALCVTVDSAAFEIAQIVGVPTVVLASPTKPGILASTMRRAVVINETLPEIRPVITRCKLKHIDGPIDYSNQCHDYGCPFAGMRYITVDRVLDAVRLQLA